MDNYLVNRSPQPSGEHEVHKSTCDHLPAQENKLLLGNLNNCQEAVKKAKEYYDNVDGCSWCCQQCHTR